MKEQYFHPKAAPADKSMQNLAAGLVMCGSLSEFRAAAPLPDNAQRSTQAPWITPRGLLF